MLEMSADLLNFALYAEIHDVYIMERHRLAFLVTIVMLALPVFALKSPTMGWSTWNTFGTNINEHVIMSQAEAMVSTGLSKAGYKYINIDDGYWDGRAANGELRVNKELFPKGMRWLVDFIHKKGLKAGIYSDSGDNTCASHNENPKLMGVGFAGHETQDCHTYFMDWDFDFIKVDNCGGAHMGLNKQEQYTKIGNAVKSCGKKDITFNFCTGAYPGKWIMNVADSWRTTCDINCSWESLRSIILQNLYLQSFTGKGHYNDADMLEIGRTLTSDEENTHMSYWCITSSPLLIGCDLTKIPEHALNLLKNKDLIAMNQDKLGLGAPMIQREGDVMVFAKDMQKLQGPKRAFVVTNLSDRLQTVQVSMQVLGYAGRVKMYDCLTHRDAGFVQGSFSVTVPAHGSAAYYAIGKRIEKTVYQAEEGWPSDYRDPLHRTVDFAESASANLGAYVKHLGGSADNYLEWQNVYSRKGGNYEMTVRYASEDPRSFTVQVNNGATQPQSNLSSGSDHDVWNTVNFKVTLKSGWNTIRLSNASAAMPNIDCMTLKVI
jgi:hypothetical protein